MKISLILAASALVVGLSGAALAAGTTTTKTTTTMTTTTKHVVHHKVAPKPAPTACSTLEWQFAKEAPKHKTSFWYSSAQWFAARGSKFCGEGETFRGEWDLRTALYKIDVTPKA